MKGWWGPQSLAVLIKSGTSIEVINSWTANFAVIGERVLAVRRHAVLYFRALPQSRQSKIKKNAVKNIAMEVI
jgi:hypothetical protein